MAKRNYAAREPVSNPLTPDEVRALLPKVGARMRRKPATDKEWAETSGPVWCQVVYVNPEHYYYTVQYQEKGCRFRESYKVPKLKGE